MVVVVVVAVGPGVVLEEENGLGELDGRGLMKSEFRVKR